MGYQVPGVLDAATCILWENRHSGSWILNLLGDMNYIQCQEIVTPHRLVIGDFDWQGLDIEGGYVDDAGFDDRAIGIAGIRKFSVR